MRKLLNITWDELQVGDMFECGSIVTHLSEWHYKDSYKITREGYEPIIVSEDHLMQIEIIGSEGRVNKYLVHSKEKRDIVGVDSNDYSWITAKDLYSCLKEQDYYAFIDGKMIKIDIEPGEAIKCRCITTNTGYYTINGIKHHNTARKLFYAMSSVQVIEDCGNEGSDGILNCKHPLGVCEKCLKKSNAVDNQGKPKFKAGDLIGGVVSTNMASQLTELTMKSFHPISALQLVAIKRNDF